MAKDYLALRVVDEGDKLDHGVRGMKWGVRRSAAQLKVAAKTDGSSDTKTDVADSSLKPAESSQARYARLKVQAGEKGPSSLSDDDLKFFNARAEAISKIAKMNQKNPNWLKETVKTVVQKSTQESLQAVSSAIVKQYVTTPVIKAAGAQPPPKKKK